MPAEISKKSTNWNCDNIISELLILHKKWSNIRHESDFDYRFIRRENASLCSAIDSKKHFESLTESYKAAGISPNCHIKIRSYGENEYERKNKFIAVIKEFVIIYGVNALNDNSINSDDLIELPRALRMGGHFGACVSARCAENLISKRSIYAQGRRLFGSWKSAVEASGISYDAEVLRKVSSRERAEYIEKFANFISKNKTNLSIKVLREKNQPIYKGLHNSHKHSPLVGAVEDFMLAALIEAEHFLCNTKEPVEEYFKKNYNEIKDKFYKDILLQQQWTEGREKGRGISKDRMAFRLFEIYGAGRRVDRRNLENSETKLDRTLLASSRRVYKNHNKALENFGFIPERLSKLYVEIDDPYTKPVLLSIFQRLMKESVENEQNRMTREYCASAEPEFHNAIIRKYKSWDRGLIEFGLDPKIFSITASGRTKRGFAFERAFRDMLERYGFLNCGCDSHIGPRNFVSGKTISKCKHLKKCRPDFVFSDFIIDTKTGIGAITDSEQIERYLQHKPIVYIVTLGGQKIEEVTDTGLIVKISFGQFIRESNSIIGVTLDGAENQILSRVLKNAAWDPFVRR